MTTDDMSAAKKVLVLEDDVLIAMDLAMLVEEAGASVIGPCHTAEQARSVAESQRPDLVLLDFNLGDHTSEDLAAWLSEREIPFVFLTGHTVHHLEGKVSGARVLEKPVSPIKLDAVLRAF